MALFNLFKKKEETKAPACCCSVETSSCCCGSHEKADTSCCCGKPVDGICCIKVLGAGCKACHEQYDYVLEAVKKLGLNVPVEEVYGVATFYAQFALNPKGKYIIGVCLGTACYVKDSQAIYDKCSEILGIKGGEITDDGLFSLEATRCIGCCGLAPVMTVNDDVYGKITADDVADILKKYN